jgi:hypothetical protein
MRTLLSILMIGCSAMIWGQAAFVLPSPTNANDTMTIYVDLSQTTYGLKGILTNHPEYKDSVYMWTWQPTGPACGNGEWGNSNDCMRMTHVNGLIYAMKMVPTQFYGCTPLQLYSTGISCLAKLDNGNAFPDDGLGEAKCEDLHIDILPALCAEKFCYFPEASRPDDFFTITYDNNLESDVNLQNLGANECYVYIAGKIGNQIYPYATPAESPNTPALQMTPVPGMPGKFRFTMIPSDFFPGVPAGSTIQQIWFYIVKPGYIPQIPTTIKYVLYNCN